MTILCVFRVILIHRVYKKCIFAATNANSINPLPFVSSVSTYFRWLHLTMVIDLQAFALLMDTLLDVYKD